MMDNGGKEMVVWLVRWPKALLPQCGCMLPAVPVNVCVASSSLSPQLIRRDLHKPVSAEQRRTLLVIDRQSSRVYFCPRIIPFTHSMPRN